MNGFICLEFISECRKNKIRRANSVCKKEMKSVKCWNLCDAEKFTFQSHINEFILKREESDTSEIFTVVIPIGGETHSQVHLDMEQIFYVIQGKGELVTEENGIEKKLDMEEKMILWIPIGAPHKIINVSANQDLKYICINAFDITKKIENESMEHANNVIDENQMEKSNLVERPVCVIGGNGFIGTEVVKSLLNHGKYVLIFDRGDESKIINDRIVYVQAKDGDDYYELMSRTCLAYAISPESMIYAAGNNEVHKHSFHYSSTDFAGQIKDNLVDAFEWISAYAKCCHQNSKTGAITVLSSVGAQKSHREMCAYDAAKAGLEGLCRSLALDYAAYGITINALEIGPVENSDSSLKDGVGDQARNLRQLIPSGKYPRVEDIAKYIVQFACNTPEFLTGQVLALDGGLTIQLRPREVERLTEKEMYEKDFE